MDIEQKQFTSTRTEWWVPCGYHTGANWTELTKAISYATQTLRSLGKLTGEPADDQITIHPHDEHVIVRILADREVSE